MIIKVCGMADTENFQGLLEIGLIDWVGMIFFYPPSRRYVPGFGHAPRDLSEVELA